MKRAIPISYLVASQGGGFLDRSSVCLLLETLFERLELGDQLLGVQQPAHFVDELKGGIQRDGRLLPP